MAARRKAGPGAQGRDRVEPQFGGRRSPPRGKRSAGKPPRGKRTFTGMLLRVGLVAAIWGAVILGGAIVYFTATMPDPILATLDDRPPNLTILASDGTVLAERGLRRGHVRLDKLPPYLPKAVIATEDRRFYHHFGLDPVGTIRALVVNARSGGVVEGGSTITQQLAKNLFLTPHRTMARKLQELVYALWLEERFSKDEILELYLNRVYFGGGTYGVEAAAQYYFGKSARQVTLSEGALLAGLLKAPSKYAPTHSIRLAQNRTDEVLQNMVAAGYLTEAEAHAAAAQPLRIRPQGDDTGYQYAVDWVAELLPDLVGDVDGDLIVDTTIDAHLQRAAQTALRDKLDSQGGRLNAHEGAVVVLDPAGSVKAVVGGRSYGTSPFNRAVKAMRQPGSAFKPFVYLAAMENGYTPDSIAYDTPVSYGGWSPKNYEGGYRGAVTLRQGLSQSINTVAVKLAVDLGPWRVTRAARRLGINSDLHNEPSIALGTSEVTLLELTSAYVPFANGGQGVLPHIIARVRSSDGKVIYARKDTSTGQVVGLPYLGEMNDMMSATLISGTGRQAAIPGVPAAGKTGTSQDFRDAWFIGYTGYYIAGVWIGNDDNDEMRHVTGGSLPAQVWRDVMLTALQGKPPVGLPGSRTPMLQQASAPMGGSEDAATPFFRRMLGIFSGG